MDITLERARRWMSIKANQETLEKAWQDLEHALSLRIKPLGLDLYEATRSELSEARAMRRLMRRIEDHDRSLDQQMRRIARRRSTSLAGALAKIEIALRMSCPAACEEVVWALVVSAAQDLREMDAVPCAVDGRASA